MGKRAHCGALIFRAQCAYKLDRLCVPDQMSAAMTKFENHISGSGSFKRTLMGYFRASRVPFHRISNKS
jgi:hypothetical protein